MSKDWEFINREQAAKILRETAKIYLDKISYLEEECSYKLNAIAGDNDKFYDKDEIIAMGRCWNLSSIPDERYPETSITDAIRETANRLLDGAVEHLKTSISAKVAKEIFDQSNKRDGS